MALKISKTPVKKQLPEGADRFVWDEFTVEKPAPKLEYGRILKHRLDKRHDR